MIRAWRIAMASRLSNRVLSLGRTKYADRTGAGDPVGVFIPLPEYLAHQFPDLSPNDDSPSHVTLLYVGKVPLERENEFLDTVHDVLARSQSEPVTATLRGEVIHWDNRDSGADLVAVQKVHFSAAMFATRALLIKALQERGFEIKDRSPEVFKPHATLSYFPNGVWENERYVGIVPTGSWTFETAEVWGFPEVTTIPMVRTITSARAIPVDKRQVEQETQKALREVWSHLKRLPQDQPIGTQNLYIGKILFQGVRGEDVPVIVMVQSSINNSTPNFIVRGGAGESPMGTVVGVILNGDKTPDEMLSQNASIYRDFRRTLLHEVTHAVDPGTGQQSGREAPKSPEEWAAYFNLPREVRAYMQEIVDQVVRSLPRKVDRVSRQVIENLLAKSRTWMEIGDLFSDKNRRKIIQAVYRAVTDALS